MAVALNVGAKTPYVTLKIGNKKIFKGQRRKRELGDATI
jgi:hypothetical protein